MSTRPAVPSALSVVVAVLAALVLPAAARASAWMPAPGDYFTELRAGVFAADSYHDTQGDRTAFGGVYEERSLRAYTELGWKKRACVVLSLPIESITARDGSGAFDRTVTGLSDLTLGLHFQLTEGATALAVEADWKAPLGYRKQDFPRLGEAQQDFTGLVQLGSAIGSRAFVDAAGGYRYRADEPADQFIANADVGIWIGPSLLALGRYRGAIAAGSGATPTDKISVQLAGPALLYRVDDRLDLVVGTFSTAAAKNEFHYDQVYVSLVFKQTNLGRLQGLLGGTHRAP